MCREDKKNGFVVKQQGKKLVPKEDIQMHKMMIKNLSKKIKTEELLSDIHLELESGHVYGVVGRNGSGKSMLFRILSGLIKPTEGEVIVDGKKLFVDIETIENLGVIIENEEMYPEFTGYQNLKFLADIKKKIGEKEIKEALYRVGLDPTDKRTVKKYSLGMRQKLAIAQAIMESPDYIFLDEPTNGLDEESVEQLHKIVLEEKERGAVIVIASHNKEDIEILCDTTFAMKNGKIKKRSGEQ